MLWLQGLLHPRVGELGVLSLPKPRDAPQEGLTQLGSPPFRYRHAHLPLLARQWCPGSQHGQST